ncbi:MAG: universal stress protein [Halobacteriales archaeon]
MTEVLLGIDTNERRARAQAETTVDLFETDDLQAYLLHDFVDNPEGASVVQVDAVHRAQEVLEAAGVAVSLREGSGDPVESIIEMAADLDVDAVCVAGRKRSPAGKMLFGSVSQSLVLESDRPVLLCSENYEPSVDGDTRDLLFGIDASEDRAVLQAETVLDLFAPNRLRAHLLHDAGTSPNMPVSEVGAVDRAREILAAADVPVAVRGGSGDPATSILDAAADVDADAICVAGRKRSPAGKMLFGSVSQSVILNTERPVLLSSPSS